MSTPTTVFLLDKPTVSGDADTWGGIENNNLDDLDIFLARPRFKKVAPTVGGTTTLDFGAGNFFEFTINQVTTIAITNVPATLPDGTVPVSRGFLRITNGGAFAITWPGSIVWPFQTGNAAPTGLAASGVDIIELVSYDAGTTWYAILHHIKTDPNLSPRVSVYKSANQSNGGAETPVTFDLERYDVGVMHDLVTNNSRLVVPANQGGLYYFYADWEFNTVPGGPQVVKVRKNGSTTIRQQFLNGSGNAVIAGHEVLAAGDYLEMLLPTGFTIFGLLANTTFELVRIR